MDTKLGKLKNVNHREAWDYEAKPLKRLKAPSGKTTLEGYLIL